MSSKSLTQVQVDAASRKEGATPFPRRLDWARLLWVVVFGVATALFAASLPLRFEALQTVCPVLRCGLSADQAIALLDLGLSASFFATYSIVLNLIHTLGFLAIGVLIFTRRSWDRMAIVVSLALIGYGVSAFGILLPLAQAEPWLSFPIELLTGFGVTTLLIVAYLFPDGRFEPPWTRQLAVVWALWMLPWYVPPRLLFESTSWGYPVWVIALCLWFSTGLYAQYYRYRHLSTPLQRQQIKWVLFGMVVAFVGYFGTTLPRALLMGSAPATSPEMAFEVVRTFVVHISLFFVPVTLAIAILRYRLWDIDLILKRTLVYVPLSAILAGLFAATIVLSQKSFVALTGQGTDAATVLTTLLVVAAFTPIKDRLQALVDKRFKETPEASRRLHILGEQIRSRVTPVNPRQLTRRLLEDAALDLGIKTGAVFLQMEGESRLIDTVGEWDGKVELNVPLEAAETGKRLGVLLLGERDKGLDYTTRDREVLEEIASVVTLAIEQDDGS